MSLPAFPAPDPDASLENSLNLILTSIAMEELSLSGLLSAESDKLKYILSRVNSCSPPTTAEVLAVNESVTHMLESATLLQLMLKQKMDRALEALGKYYPPQPCPPSPCPPPYPPQPCPPPCVTKPCAAVLTCRCTRWQPLSRLAWTLQSASGTCCCDTDGDNTKLILPGGRYSVGFAVNYSAECLADTPPCPTAAVSLQMTSRGHSTDLFVFRQPLLGSDHPATLTAGGLIIEVPRDGQLHSLSLKLLSESALDVEQAVLNIFEI